MKVRLKNIFNLFINLFIKNLSEKLENDHTKNLKEVDALAAIGDHLETDRHSTLQR